MRRATKSQLESKIRDLQERNEMQAYSIKQYRLEQLSSHAAARDAQEMWTGKIGSLELVIDQHQHEIGRLNAHVKAGDELAHKLNVQLAEEVERRHRAEEAASGLLRELSRAMELAAERGKINSVLVRRINELESGS